MKKILVSIAVTSLLMTGCVDDSANYNDNIDRAYNVPAETLVANAEKELIDQMTTPNVNLNPFRYFSQYWAPTTYTTEARYRLSTRKVPDNHFRILYANVLSNLKSAEASIALEPQPLDLTSEEFQKRQNNKTAIAEILQVYTYQILVDTFGNIPYTDALNVDIALPKYDAGAAVYPKLIERLNAAIAIMDDSSVSFLSGDVVYEGDVTNWMLFANSLKLKLGLNLSDSNATLAQSTVESAVADGVIKTNDKNAVYEYPTFAPNYNPVYDNLIASNRHDFVPANTIVNAMNAKSDPRRAKYFTLYNGAYVGGKYGYASGSGFSTHSHISDEISRPDFASQLMEATEVNFYLAEAAARGFSVGNSADFYYEAAIRASFEFWGVSTADADDYMTRLDVAYATATGTWQEKIGNQAWYALFNRGFESWSSYRRLDYPALVAPANALDGVTQVPKRFSFPVNEQTVNGANYSAAVDAIGGSDDLITHVFWDVN